MRLIAHICSGIVQLLKVNLGLGSGVASGLSGVQITGQDKLCIVFEAVVILGVGPGAVQTIKSLLEKKKLESFPDFHRIFAWSRRLSSGI